MAVSLSSLPHLPCTTECTDRLYGWWFFCFLFPSSSSQYFSSFCKTQTSCVNPSRTHLQLQHHPGKQKQLESLQFFFIKPCFSPFQLAVQLLILMWRADLATLLDFSSALCCPPICRQTKRELDGFSKLERAAGSPSTASHLKLLTMNNGNTLAPRRFCTPCGVPMGPRAWTWLWDRGFWFPAFFVRRRAEARASTGVFPCYTQWHLPLRGCFVSENSKSVKQRTQKRAMYKCPINFIPHERPSSAGKHSIPVSARHAPGDQTNQKMVLASVLFLGANIPSAKTPASPWHPNG